MTGGAHFFPLTTGDPGDCAPILCIFVKYVVKLGSMNLGFSAVVFCHLTGLEVFLCTGSHGNSSFLNIDDQYSK